MIYETIVSTLDASGRPNFAPMGIALMAEEVILRPFRTAHTWRNLQDAGEGVVNFTDNVLLFARCALLSEVPPHRPAAGVRGAVLQDVCHWKEFVVSASDVSKERAEFHARIVSQGRQRDFLGFNRAQHAVVEATILATRLHLLRRDVILTEIARLEPLVAKTGGEREREAFGLVTTVVETSARAVPSYAKSAERAS
jgi:hypothetical protein